MAACSGGGRQRAPPTGDCMGWAAAGLVPAANSESGRWRLVELEPSALPPPVTLPMSAWPVQPSSRLLAGRYQLDQQLGAGRPISVWQGYDRVLGRGVLVKLLYTQVARGEARARFQQQAIDAARLCHPNIV